MTDLMDEGLPAGVVDAYPLSVAQAGMVHHMELDPDLLPYHNVHSWTVAMPFDAGLLRRAVHDVVARHPALRTSFDFVSHDEPTQLVHAVAVPPVVVEDLRELPEEEADRVLHALWQAERTRPFDVARPPLLRVFAHRRTDEVFQWTVTDHHAILDDASRQTVHTGILDRYRTLLTDRDAPADPAPPQEFRDFVARERQIAADPDEQRYWTGRLAGHEPSGLPRWPGSGRGGTPRTIESPVDDALVTRLAALADRLGTPIRTVLLAAHLKVVGAVSGSHDVVTGTVTAARPAATGTCGVFVNVPPLRVELTGGTWRDLVRRVGDAERDALPHTGYPLASIQWGLGSTALFDTTFEFLPFPTDPPAFRAAPTHYALATAFLYDPAGSRLVLRLDYHDARTPDEQVAAIRDTYLTVLDAMTDADAHHEDLCPLDEDARRRMIVDWNGPARPYPVDRCVHELIEEQAHRTPDALAVTDGVVSLSYAELDRRANRLARLLLAEGAAPERVVAIMAERSAEMVVLMLAILKSGAAYLPLEPQYPADRLRYLLEDSGALLVLAQPALTARVPDGPWTVLDTGRAAAEAAALPDGGLGRTSTPDNLMYVIYTSGSTGKPKGVLVPHFGVVNYLGWCMEGYAAEGAGGAPVFSSIAFDMIVPNLYTPLITGERLCMLDDALDPVALADRLVELAPFTFIKMTPGHLDLLDQLLDAEQAQRLATTLAVGADAFPTRILTSWRRKDPVSVVLNEYGPTEASVGNTVYVPSGPVTADQVPIGRAIPNTTMYVLDQAMNPVPLGVTGELYIGGDCVVRGYAGKPRLTAERFVPDPFSAKPGARMYRTGDLGRWLPEGALEFQGRRDDQLKVNGYRVELGEIESVLVEHPDVNQAVAAVVGGTGDQARLVGYYMTDTPISEKKLLAHLAERLPAYMVPSTLLAIDRLPLNANGKVDRKALPNPIGSAEDTAGEPPEAGVETVVAQAWRESLYLDEVSRTDDFLTLGGNSLLATETVLRLRARGVEVSLADLMRGVTLADLAAGARQPEAPAPQAKGAAVVDAARLLGRIDRYAAIGHGDAGGMVRVGFSDHDNEARAALLRDAAGAGLAGSVDAAGNVLVRRPAGVARTDRPVLLLGSHMDTVVNGGRLDGAYGVLAALEVLQAIVEAGAEPSYEPVVVAFSNEEGARFPQPFFGSKVLAGRLDELPDDPCDHDGVSLREPLARAGGDLDRLASAVWQPGSVAGYLELHIEQGPVLEAAGERIGVVSAITGRTVLIVVVRGKAGHAGTTPMELRRDPLTVASRMVLAVESLARERRLCRVSTVGRVDVRPNSPNTIAEEVVLTVDLRDSDPDRLAQAEKEVRELVGEFGAARGVAVDVSVSTRSGPVHADPRLMAAIADSATELGYPHRTMPSGAGHDAQIVAGIAPIGMVFVPSIDGVSHVPEEDTAAPDLVAGAEVLLHTVLRL
jgi:hydantoinase/carbamoylase family amidase